MSSVNIIKELFFYFLGAAVIILALVSFYTVFYSWKYRKKNISEDDEEPEQIHDNKRFEFWMIALSLALVSVFFVYSLNAMNRIHKIPEHPKADLVIIGHQWWWEANYTNDGFTTANEIHIPAGKNILVKLNSFDVIHSWWVPKLGRKMDLMPGYDNYMWMYADKPGVYKGACSEFCGAQHGWMKIRLIAQTPENYQKWKSEQLSSSIAKKDSLFYKGQKLFQSKTCTTCHSTVASQQKPDIGPNLGNFARRKYFLSNIKLNNTKNLKEWLRDPQNVKPGANMPNFALTNEEVNALTHYLQNLK